MNIYTEKKRILKSLGLSETEIENQMDLKFPEYKKLKTLQDLGLSNKEISQHFAKQFPEYFESNKAKDLGLDLKTPIIREPYERNDIMYDLIAWFDTDYVNLNVYDNADDCTNAILASVTDAFSLTPFEILEPFFKSILSDNLDNKYSNQYINISTKGLPINEQSDYVQFVKKRHSDQIDEDGLRYVESLDDFVTKFIELFIDLPDNKFYSSIVDSITYDLNYDLYSFLEPTFENEIENNTLIDAITFEDPNLGSISYKLKD